MSVRFFIGLTICVLVACAGPTPSPERDSAAPPDDAVQMVEQQMGLVTEGRTARYVNAVGARLAANAGGAGAALRFFVVDMEAPNAFALEGG